MITIKTEKHTYTAKMGAEESEKLFRELIMELFGYTGRLTIPETEEAVIPETEEAVIPETEEAVIPEIHTCEAKNEEKAEEKPDVMKEPEEYIEDKYSVDPVTEPEPVGKENDGYSGFLHIKCQHCGKEKTYCSKHRIKYYECKNCGERTELKGMVRLYTNCECGKKAIYWTNTTEKAFDVCCVECEQPVAVMYNGKKNQYETIQ